MAVVNITDEKLAINNKLPQKPDVHSKVGSVIIASTLMCFLGSLILGIITQKIWLDPISLSLALISAVTMVAYWVPYFYLIQIYSVHLIVPLNQLSSIWLLIMEDTYKTPIGICTSDLHLGHYIILGEKSLGNKLSYRSLLLAVDRHRKFGNITSDLCEEIQSSISI